MVQSPLKGHLLHSLGRITTSSGRVKLRGWCETRVDGVDVMMKMMMMMMMMMIMMMKMMIMMMKMLLLLLLMMMMMMMIMIDHCRRQCCFRMILSNYCGIKWPDVKRFFSKFSLAPPPIANVKLEDHLILKGQSSSKSSCLGSMLVFGGLYGNGFVLYLLGLQPSKGGPNSHQNSEFNPLVARPSFSPQKNQEPGFQDTNLYILAYFFKILFSN